MQVGSFAHAIASLRQHQTLQGPDRADFDIDLAARLRRALATVKLE